MQMNNSNMKTINEAPNFDSAPPQQNQIIDNINTPYDNSNNN